MVEVVEAGAADRALLVPLLAEMAGCYAALGAKVAPKLFYRIGGAALEAAAGGTWPPHIGGEAA